MLRDSLKDHGILLKIVDIQVGQDIDQEVFAWLNHCKCMLAFGTDRYGQDTGNPACTYREMKYAQCTSKKVILLKMTNHFKFDLAKQVFCSKEHTVLEWMQGTPMPTVDAPDPSPKLDPNPNPKLDPNPNPNPDPSVKTKSESVIL